MAENEHKTHPGVAAVLSFVFNGLGQLYNGEIVKGLFIIFLSSLSMLVLISGSAFIGFYLRKGAAVGGTLLPLGIMLFAGGLISAGVVGIYSIVNAYKVACKK
jgi:TM2 domain-containing membrane protein YozV